ncbi:MAG: HAD family phosphatase [Lentisphaerales bacterium]|nr:HAD family phosphatase [Lentisphaerales bacterium]
MIKAVLFDLDGTLVDSESSYLESLKSALEENSLEIPVNLEELFYGLSWQGIFDNLRKHNIDFQSVSRMVMAVDKELAKGGHKIEAYPEAMEVFREISKTLPTTIVSGSTRQQIGAVIEEYDLQGNLDFYVGAEDYEQGKPMPECYLQAAELLNVNSQDCLAFEDSQAGVEAAKAAGMWCVGVDRDRGQNLQQADWVVKSLDQFSFSQIPYK